MPSLDFKNDTLGSYIELQHGDRKTLDKVNQQLTELKRHPLSGTGKIEKLKGRPHTYSRRIDKKNRIVFKYDGGDTVGLLEIGTHYGDK